MKRVVVVLIATPWLLIAAIIGRYAFEPEKKPTPAPQIYSCAERDERVGDYLEFAEAAPSKSEEAMWRKAAAEEFERYCQK